MKRMNHGAQYFLYNLQEINIDMRKQKIKFELELVYMDQQMPLETLMSEVKNINLLRPQSLETIINAYTS